MITFPNSSAFPPGGFVLVLLDGTEKDLLGIWGPYTTEADAQLALKELNLWPIDGIWDLHPLKHFPVPRTQTPTYRDHGLPTQRTWHDGQWS